MKLLATITLTFLLSWSLSAQFSINNGLSSIEIDGTSNVHDWTEVVETIKGSADATFSGNDLTNLSSLEITIPVKSIKSGKSTMDKNTYKAMDANKYPDVNFNLKSASISGNKVLCTGNLTIAGKTQSVTVTTTYKVVPAKKQLILSGSYKMKMTSFGIDPPTAMLGAMTTGDDLTIRFNLVLN